MLRTEIMRGLANVLASVEESQVLDVVERVYRELTRQSGEVRVTEVLEAYQKFLLAYNSRFGEAERTLMRTLQVHEFAEAEWWSHRDRRGRPAGGKTAEARIQHRPPALPPALRRGLPAPGDRAAAP